MPVTDVFQRVFCGRKMLFFVLRHFRLRISVFYDIMRKGRKGVRFTPSAGEEK